MRKGFPLEDTYDELSVQGFPQHRLIALVDSGIVEKALWPVYTSHSRKQSLLLVWLLKTRRSLNLGTFSHLELDQAKFSDFFRAALHLSLDFELSFIVRSACLSVVIDAFTNLDIIEVQRECQQLVSILCWQNLVPTHRDTLLNENPKLRKRYKARLKALNNATKEERTFILFETDYVHTIAVELFAQMNKQRSDASTLTYCCKIVELLSTLLSQLPTRRYVVSLLRDLQISTIIRSSHRFINHPAQALEMLKFKSAFRMFESFYFVPYDDVEGNELSSTDASNRLSKNILRLQHLAFTKFKDSLMIMALSHHATIKRKTDLLTHLEDLNDADLIRLCEDLSLRTEYEHLTADRSKVLRQVICDIYEGKSSFQENLASASVLPTEASLFSPEQDVLAYDPESASTLLPRLTLQYLSINDLLHRVFTLYQATAWLSVRTDLSQTIEKLVPKITRASSRVTFEGFSLNALSIEPPVILEVTPPTISSQGFPGLVRAEVKITLDPQSSSSWRKLHAGDVVYCLHLAARKEDDAALPPSADPSFLRKVGVQSIRAAVIEAVLNNEGQPYRAETLSTYSDVSSQSRILRVLFDNRAFSEDKMTGRLEDVYDNLNLLVKRPAERNGYLPILRQIQDLARLSRSTPPEWLNEAILGFGDSSPSTVVAELSLMDTFVDLHHIEECLPKDYVYHSPNESVVVAQPENYTGLTNARLRELLSARELSTTGNKPDLLARLQENDKEENPKNHTDISQDFSSLAFSITQAKPSDVNGESPSKVLISRRLPPRGPRHSDRPKRNVVRYSKTQLEAICGAMSPGLCLIDGPAGSGKGLVVSQILNNIYHSTSSERSLVLCSSNANVESVIGRLRQLDIDEMHLLQVVSGSPSPQIDKILSKKATLLQEVTRLAKSLGHEGDHGSTSETAGYFYTTTIKPIIAKSLQAEIPESTRVALQIFFPGDQLDEKDYLQGCVLYLERLFAQLRELRPLELLRNKERQEEYLLTKGARIVVMTADHASLMQNAFAALDMTINNIVLEQASSLTELESLCPILFMQDPSKVTRVLLVGDTKQLQTTKTAHPEIAVQCMANQSLFERLLRTGCAVRKLKEQGRCRSSLADVYRHRYTELSDLPEVQKERFTTANAGLLHTCQFVEVAKYKGQGALSPRPGVWQNLGEAEYVVALYQYMRLLDYPAEQVTILTPFAGQKTLIEDVLDARCRRSPIFGLPRVATVAEYQSQETDFVLLSLVRTSDDSELRDARMMTTALSRARLGLYVFGRSAVLKPSVSAFFVPLRVATDDKLELVTGEMYGNCARLEKQGSERTARMENVEHLGKYVYQMTETRMAHLTRPAT